jgi:heme-degrading monooxygenase HmoA
VIIRVFKPTIHPGKEREFEAFLRDTAVPLVSQQAGLVAQHVGRPRDPSSTEYVYVTVWEDVESVRAFAGERWRALAGGRDHPGRGAPAQGHLDRALRGPPDT